MKLPIPTWHDLMTSPPEVEQPTPINLPPKNCPSMKSFFWKKSNPILQGGWRENTKLSQSISFFSLKMAFYKFDLSYCQDITTYIIHCVYTQTILQVKLDILTNSSNSFKNWFLGIFLVQIIYIFTIRTNCIQIIAW